MTVFFLFPSNACQYQVLPCIWSVTGRFWSVTPTEGLLEMKKAYKAVSEAGACWRPRLVLNSLAVQSKVVGSKEFYLFHYSF